MEILEWGRDKYYFSGRAVVPGIERCLKLSTILWAIEQGWKIEIREIRTLALVNANREVRTEKFGVFLSVFFFVVKIRNF